MLLIVDQEPCSPITCEGSKEVVAQGPLHQTWLAEQEPGGSKES